MNLPSYFTDFLSEIRLTDKQVDDCITGYKTLRKRLLAWEALKPIYISTFIQGSYRRATAVRPYAGNRADVDLVLVTNLPQKKYPVPADVFALFLPFLEEYYAGKYEIQGRSIGIELSYVDLDLVVTSAPCEEDESALILKSITSEASLEEAGDWMVTNLWVPPDERSTMTFRAFQEAQKTTEWQLSPLYIPDRDAQTWRPTHPIAQMQWTRDKNKRCQGHYINVVKALKWWRVINSKMPQYPKGYPLEHLIGVCCPDGITSVGEGIVRTLESIVTNYRSHALLKTKPVLSDHGVPEHDVFKRISVENFAQFYEQAEFAARIARQAFDATKIAVSVDEWQKLFGGKFPSAPSEPDDTHTSAKASYSVRETRTTIAGGRFA